MKKFFGLLTVFTLLLTMAAGTVFSATADSAMIGDVNGDEKVNSLDALIAIRVVAGLPYSGTVQTESLFVSGDCTVDTADAVLLLRHAADPTVPLTGIPDGLTAAKTADGLYYIEQNRLDLLCLNVRHSYGEVPNTKIVRIYRIQKLLAEYLPAVVGFQEVRPWWMNEEATADKYPGLPEVMPNENYEGYVYYRNEQNAPDTEGREGCAIFYDTSVVTLLQKGSYWLSDTPDTESKYEASSTYRNAAWGKFRVNATGEEFYFHTVHIDTAADVQAQQYNVMMEQSQKIAAAYGEAPVIYCGDFNFLMTGAAYAAVTESGVTDVALALNDLTGTFPNWGNNNGSANPRGDYFCITGDIYPAYYEVDTRVFDPETEEAFQLDRDTYAHEFGYYSDHSPIYMEGILY